MDHGGVEPGVMCAGMKGMNASHSEANLSRIDEYAAGAGAARSVRACTSVDRRESVLCGIPLSFGREAPLGAWGNRPSRTVPGIQKRVAEGGNFVRTYKLCRGAKRCYMVREIYENELSKL